MDELSKSLGYRYYRETCFDREQLIEGRRPTIEPTTHTRNFPEKERLKMVLPELDSDLWHLLEQRRSRRKYQNTPIKEEELTALLWAAQGVTAEAGPFLLRTSPSAGALHPLETYVIANRVSGVEKGLYHLEVASFSLEKLSSGNLAAQVARAAIHQQFIERAAVVVVFSALFRRNFAKYGDRGMRYICMDAGHACENLLLAAEALGLAACPVAAFFDDEMNELIGIDGEEEGVLYLAAIGKPEHKTP